MTTSKPPVDKSRIPGDWFDKVSMEGSTMDEVLPLI